MMNKPASRPSPIAVLNRTAAQEPSPSGDDVPLSKSLGDSFLLASAMNKPLHRQISEVSTIIHSGYLFKRSNKPYQQLSPFPVESLEIAVDTQSDAIETEIVAPLRPRPSAVDNTFLRDSHANSNDNNHLSSHQPILFPDPVASLANRFQMLQDSSHPESAPLVPMLSNDITGSISTKATEVEETDESLLAESARNRNRQLALEESLNSPAAFFGINVDFAFHPAPNDCITPSAPSAMNGVTPSPPPIDTNDSRTSRAQPTSPPQPRGRSAPIKVNNASAPIKVKKGSSPKRESGGSFDHSYSRRCSAPCVYDSNASPGGDGTLGSARARPPDYVDPKDGHLWRAKYCVLEEGILYFYRNSEDADSQEAKKERRTTDLFAGDPTKQRASITDSKDLSKSPMASRSLINLANADGSSFSGGSNSDAESGFLWEKRVALTCVGAVRSAETEFGDNAFELLAVDDDEDEGYTNKLVLKAMKPEEMSEWLFQFHRSLASFVRNVVDWVGATSPAYALGDLHHPRFDHGSIASSMQTPIRSSNMPAFSPRFDKHMPAPKAAGASLSHGHGRTRRRRKGGKGLSESQSVHSVPTTPLSQSPTNLHFTLSNFSAQMNLVTPLNNGKWKRPPEEIQTPARQQPLPEEAAPELSAPKSANPPETDHPPGPAPGGKYVPPHLRKKYVPPHMRNKEAPADEGPKLAPRKYIPPHLRKKESASIGPATMPPEEVAATSKVAKEVSPEKLKDTSLKLGGCADPQVIAGSILDKQFVPRKSSRVGPVQTAAYGSEGGGVGKVGRKGDADSNESSAALAWEIGAVSECGIRNSNEDSYIIANNLVEVFGDLMSSALAPTYWDSSSVHQSGLFAIFDGHCGNEAARFAAEKLPHFLYGESIGSESTHEINPKMTEEIMRRAISKLDSEFCRICVEDDREWDSGSTALIAMLANEHLVIASVGDCRGVLGRIVNSGLLPHPAISSERNWNELQAEQGEVAGQRCFWMEVADVHSPSRPDEKARIEKAGGWTTTEKEIPISQLQRMDFLDEDVRGILQRCLRIKDGEGTKACSSAPQRILEITRVCGELAVSRAIGDRDFKAACNTKLAVDDDDELSSEKWECQLFLPYPDNHNRHFVGDLVSGQPDFQCVKVGEADVQGEFLILACDGLWDVMDMDDAVRVTRDLLYEKNYPAKQAAARLAELAIHLGSSDNITVIIVKLITRKQSR